MDGKDLMILLKMHSYYPKLTCLVMKWPNGVSEKSFGASHPL